MMIYEAREIHIPALLHLLRLHSSATFAFIVAGE